MHPDARLADGSVHAMKVINRVWKEFNRALPDRLTRSADFLFLLPESYRCGTARQKFSYPHLTSDYYGPMLGTFRFLLDGGFSFQTVPEFALERNLSQEKTVIITGAESLTEKTNLLLKEFVRKGGKLLFCGNIPVLKDGTLPDYCGIISAKKSLHTCIYLPGKVKYGRTLVRGNIWELSLAGAKPVMFGYPQDYAEAVKDSPYPYYNASAPTELNLPLLTRNRYGKGVVYFLNCGLLIVYLKHFYATATDTNESDWCNSNTCSTAATKNGALFCWKIRAACCKSERYLGYRNQRNLSNSYRSSDDGIGINQRL
jgi:hypothetical protein